MVQGIERVTSARPQQKPTAYGYQPHPQTLYGLLTNNGLRTGTAFNQTELFKTAGENYNSETVHKRQPS
jgi:hypothetical protein